MYTKELISDGLLSNFSFCVSVSLSLVFLLRFCSRAYEISVETRSRAFLYIIVLAEGQEQFFYVYEGAHTYNNFLRVRGTVF